jgi:hypothetical protein
VSKIPVKLRVPISGSIPAASKLKNAGGAMNVPSTN